MDRGLDIFLNKILVLRDIISFRKKVTFFMLTTIFSLRKYVAPTKYNYDLRLLWQLFETL